LQCSRENTFDLGASELSKTDKDMSQTGALHLDSRSVGADSLLGRADSLTLTGSIRCFPGSIRCLPGSIRFPLGSIRYLSQVDSRSIQVDSLFVPERSTPFAVRPAPHKHFPKDVAESEPVITNTVQTPCTQEDWHCIYLRP
jgi:hypothetical protein